MILQVTLKLLASSGKGILTTGLTWSRPSPFPTVGTTVDGFYLRTRLPVHLGTPGDQAGENDSGQ